MEAIIKGWIASKDWKSLRVALAKASKEEGDVIRAIGKGNMTPEEAVAYSAWCKEVWPSVEAAAYKKAALKSKCPKCGGKGYLAEYRHVERGDCFKCNGTGALGGVAFI